MNKTKNNPGKDQKATRNMGPWILSRSHICSYGLEYIDGHSFLKGIFPSQGSNPGLLHWRQILHPLRHLGSPNTSDSYPAPHCVSQLQPEHHRPGALNDRNSFSRGFRGWLSKAKGLFWGRLSPLVVDGVILLCGHVHGPSGVFW